MANHFSAVKRARQTDKRTATNRANKSRLRSALRRFRTALATNNREQAETEFKQTVSMLDKAVQKGVLHKNTASRYKARLSARVSKVAKA